MNIPDIDFSVAPENGMPQRKVVTSEYPDFPDQVNTGSVISRQRYFQRLAERIGCNPDALCKRYDAALVQASYDADAKADHDAAANVTADKRPPSQATGLVDLAADAELWHAAEWRCVRHGRGRRTP